MKTYHFRNKSCIAYLSNDVSGTESPRTAFKPIFQSLLFSVMMQKVVIPHCTRRQRLDEDSENQKRKKKAQEQEEMKLNSFSPGQILYPSIHFTDKESEEDTDEQQLANPLK
mgnify:CR=1 FL=1